MDQELKQRLIGAVVITALAAIFVPMLFDDPVEESGQTVNELSLPEAPVEPFEKTAEQLPENANPQWAEQSAQPIDPSVKPGEQIASDDEGLTQEELDYMGPVEDGSELQPVKKIPLPPSLVQNSNDTATLQADEDKPITGHDSNVSQNKISESQPERIVSTAPVDGTSNWYIQPGSFSKQDNAFALRDKLRSQGFTASVEEYVVSGKKSYRVLVGPESDKNRAQATRSRLDSANNLKSLVLPLNKPKIVEPIAKAAPILSKTAADSPASVTQSSKPASSQVSGLVKWYIQLGSFSQQENADSLRDKLRAKGLPAFVTEVNTSQGKAYRLRVGPELDKKRAESILSRLANENNLKGFLVSE
ncbi:MAG: hypothetical protein Kow0065_05490 [Methylomicrobium sp.]